MTARRRGTARGPRPRARAVARAGFRQHTQGSSGSPCNQPTVSPGARPVGAWLRRGETWLALGHAQTHRPQLRQRAAGQAQHRLQLQGRSKHVCLLVCVSVCHIHINVRTPHGTWLAVWGHALGASQADQPPPIARYAGSTTTQQHTAAEQAPNRAPKRSPEASNAVPTALPNTQADTGMHTHTQTVMTGEGC